MPVGNRYSWPEVAKPVTRYRARCYVSPRRLHGERLTLGKGTRGMRSFIMRLGAVLVAALLAMGLLSAPAHAGTATLSGTITSDATGEPVGGCVTAYGTDFAFMGSACSETGQWSMEVESGVAYKLEVNAWDGRHLGEWAHDAHSFDDAVPFVAPASVDITLQVGGTIGGSLRRADGSAAEGASVHVLDTDDYTTAAWTSVGASPETGDEWWTLVPPGEYVVEYWDDGATQWAVGQTSAETATRFTVTADAMTRVDDRFLGRATVRGTVVSDATGEPIEGVCVVVRGPGNPDDSWWGGESCTGADGAYELELAESGTYIAQFTDSSGDHVAEYSGDTTDIGEAATFDVTRETPAVVDASLAKASVITGRTVDAKSGAPIAEACPHAYLGHDGDFLAGQVAECSGSDGRWSVKGLPAGDYAVSLTANGEPRTYAQAWAFKADSQATATLISVSAGSTKAVRDVQLMPGGTFSGVVTGPTGEPVADAYVSIDSGYSGRAGGPGGPIYTQTDELGRYTLHGVPAGDHTVFVEPRQWSGLAPLWSGNADRREDAVALRVRANKDTTYNAVLSAGARVTGSVYTADGQPTADYWVGLIYTTSGDYIGDFDVYDGNTFSSTFLPPGDFKLQLRRYTEDGDEEIAWYDSATSEADATVVTLQRGETRDITVHLP